MTSQKLIKIGNSTGIILPAKYLNALSLKIGDTLTLELGGDQITLTVENAHQLSLLNASKSQPQK